MIRHVGRAGVCSPLVLAFALIGTGVSMAQGFDHSHDTFGSVLRAHVKDGLVDYKALKTDPLALNRYLASTRMVSRKEFYTWSEPQRLAFLINLYNAATLELILDHYPVDSIKDIGSVFKGPWDQAGIRLFGKKITLNNLEHDIVRKDYNEPRIHMALVCAARGCPILRSEVYRAERLNDQLNEQSRNYLASPAGMRIERTKGTVYLSAIFKWYGKDFASIPAFVEQHSGQKVKALKIRYLDYDWRLNKHD